MKEWLRQQRKNKGLCAADVATAAQVSYKSYNAYETGRRRPSVAAAKRIAAVLDFDWTMFYAEE